MRLMAIGLWAVLCLAGVPVMANSKPFVCANEKDHLPPLDPQADAWYREAAALAKPDTLRPWAVSSSFTARQWSAVIGRPCIIWRIFIVQGGPEE